jgi:hypothetical protein
MVVIEEEENGGDVRTLSRVLVLTCRERRRRPRRRWRIESPHVVVRQHLLE